jgi:hypothetical protein
MKLEDDLAAVIRRRFKGAARIEWLETLMRIRGLEAAG